MSLEPRKVDISERHWSLSGTDTFNKSSFAAYFVFCIRYYIIIPPIPQYLLELFHELDPKDDVHAPYFGNLLYALFELGAKSEAIKLFSLLEKSERGAKLKEVLTLLRPMVMGIEKNPEYLHFDDNQFFILNDIIDITGK